MNERCVFIERGFSEFTSCGGKKLVENQPKWFNYVITVQLSINLKSMWSYWFKTKLIVNLLMKQHESRDGVNNH